MSRGFITFRYFQSNSPLHRSSPAAKMLWLILVVVVALAFSNVYISVFLIISIWAVGRFLGGIRLNQLKPVGLIVVFTIALSVFLGFTTPARMATGVYAGLGGISYQFSGLALSAEGMARGFIVGARIMAILLAGIVYSATTNPRDIMQSFVQAGMNYRYAYAGAMGVTLIPVYQDMASTVSTALKVRGFTGGSIGKRIRSWMRYIFLLLAGTLRKADKMGLAMENKGFGAYKTRTSIRETSYESRVGHALVVVWVCLMAAFVVLIFLGKL
jgi:energy-coupling factor transport system permease protein